MFAASLYSTLMARENTVTIVGRKLDEGMTENITKTIKKRMKLL